jgi:hypothetical protein
MGGLIVRVVRRPLAVADMVCAVPVWWSSWSLEAARPGSRRAPASSPWMLEAPEWNPRLYGQASASASRVHSRGERGLPTAWRPIPKYIPSPPWPVMKRGRGNQMRCRCAAFHSALFPWSALSLAWRDRHRPRHGRAAVRWVEGTPGPTRHKAKAYSCRKYHIWFEPVSQPRSPGQQQRTRGRSATSPLASSRSRHRAREGTIRSAPVSGEGASSFLFPSDPSLARASHLLMTLLSPFSCACPAPWVRSCVCVCFVSRRCAWVLCLAMSLLWCAFLCLICGDVFSDQRRVV